MPNDTQIAKWGNSLAIRIPHAIAEQAGVAEGDRLSLDVTRDGAIVLRSARPRYTLQDLVTGITPKNRHMETDWGKPFGREQW